MKYNSRSVLVVLLLALTTSACEDSIINLTPQSELTEADFYKTAQDINNAVIGIYDHYQEKMPDDWHLKEFPSDHLHISTYRSVTGLNAVGNLDFDPANPIFASFWQTNYNGIYRANAVLDNIDNPGNYRGNERAQYEGEAKFMRALYYFDLVRAFGGVPLITSRISVDEAFNTPRASEEEIYNLIISDLEDAIESLPRREEVPVGRTSRGAAVALLGKVYIYLEDWDKALTYLDDVSDYGYRLEDDYATLFTIEGENNNEFIFQMPYVADIQGQELSSDFVPYDGAEGITPSGNEVALPSWSLHKLFDEDDPRKEVTITEYWRNPASDEEPSWYPYGSKYAVPHPPSSSGLDLPVLRYADIVLLKAEALYRQGDEAAALAELNRIRERAFGDASHNYVDASNFMDKLMRERQLELALEGERWFDLVRTGRFLDEMTVHEREYNPNTGTATTVTNEVEPYMARFPIPQHEINQAEPGVLEQNEGYN